MKKIILYGIMYALLLSSCRKNKDIASGTPKCVSNEIAANKDNMNWEVGNIDEYTFQGKTVYAFEPDEKVIADGFTAIKDGSCKTICNLGGIAGFMNCNGENFYQEAKLQRNIWKK